MAKKKPTKKLGKKKGVAQSFFTNPRVDKAILAMQDAIDKYLTKMSKNGKKG